MAMPINPEGTVAHVDHNVLLKVECNSEPSCPGSGGIWRASDNGERVGKAIRGLLRRSPQVLVILGVLLVAVAQSCSSTMLLPQSYSLVVMCLQNDKRPQL